MCSLRIASQLCGIHVGATGARRFQGAHKGESMRAEWVLLFLGKWSRMVSWWGVEKTEVALLRLPVLHVSRASVVPPRRGSRCGGENVSLKGLTSLIVQNVARNV